MNKFILSFMCKNEEHIVHEMLQSAIPLADIIVALDTGSNDSTIDIIKNFGSEHNIPTYIYESPFIDYSTSRNILLKHTIDTAQLLRMNLSKTYWFTIDCDDIMVINNNFNFQSLTEYIYKIRFVTPNGLSYCKNVFNRCDADCQWEGIVHEYLKTSNPIHYIDDVIISIQRRGKSWEGDLADKYLQQALKYEAHLTPESDPRWVFYTAETYMLTYTPDGLAKAIEYYLKRIEIGGGNIEEVYYSHIQLFDIKRNLGYNELECINHLLLAYEVLPDRAESLRFLTEVYMAKQQFNIAYMYSTILFKNHNGKSIMPKYDMYIREDLTQYIIAIDHVFICSIINDIDGMISAHQYLLSIKNSLPDYIQDKVNYNDSLFKMAQ